MAYLYRLRSNRYSRLPHHGGRTNHAAYGETDVDHHDDWDPQMPSTEYRNEMFDQLQAPPEPKSDIEQRHLLDHDQLANS